VAIASDGRVLLGAENQPEGGVITVEPVLLFVKTDVAIHLSDVLMGELSYLQVHQERFPTSWAENY